MPKVPTYDGPQVRTAPLQGGLQDAGAYTTGARENAALGAALGRAGEQLDRVVMREAQRKAYDAQTAVQAEYLDFQEQMVTQRTNGKAVGVRDDVDAWWAKAKEKASANLDPMSKRIVSDALSRTHLQSTESFSRFEAQQLKNATLLSFNAAKTVAKSVAAANPSAVVVGVDDQGNAVTQSGVDFAVADLRRKNAEYAANEGLTDPKVLQAMNLKDTTELHTQVLQGMQRVAPDQARAYFEKYKGQIDGAQHAEISHQLDTVGNLAKAQAIGLTLAQKYAYEQANEGQAALDAMGLPPELAKAARDEMEHRHAKQLTASNVANAANVGKVHEMIFTPGMSKARIMATPEYQALRDKGAMLQAIDSKNYSDLLRANAVDARALAKLERHEQELRLSQADAAYGYSDPIVLHGMPREAIANMRPKLGTHWTEHLLAKKDSLAKSETKLREAKMDQDDFNLVAHSFGLDPIGASKSEKLDLLTTKARVEQLIDEWQTKNQREMPREEKNKLLRSQLAATVTVSRWYGTEKVPMGPLSETQMGDLVVPADDRVSIVAAQRKFRGDETYTPSEATIKAEYYKRQQRARAGFPSGD